MFETVERLQSSVDGIEVEDDDRADSEEPPNAKKRKLERAEADKERSALLDKAPGPEGRLIRSRMSVEEKVLLEKHTHDMMIETQKLEIEEQREIRLKEESERRDAIAKS